MFGSRLTFQSWANCSTATSLCLFVVALSICTSTPAVADEDDTAQRIPSGVRDLYSPVEEALKPQDAMPGGPRPYSRNVLEGGAATGDRTSVLRRTKEKLEYSNPFFRDLTVDVYGRSQYLDTHNSISTLNQAWAAGGGLSVRTGYFQDWLMLEAAAATSQPLYAPAGEGGTLLLTQDQSEISSLYIGNAHARFLGQELVAGRQLIKTPYLNPYDTRMIPNAFEGAVMTRQAKKVDWWDYSVGYFTQFKARDSSTFEPFSEELGVLDVDRGVFLSGVKVVPWKGLTVGGFNYLVTDILNTSFAETDWILPHALGGVDIRFSANYTNQQTVGDELMTGAPFATSQVSGRVAAGYNHVTGYLAVSSNSDNAGVVSPFSSYPVYTALAQLKFQEAGATAIVGGLSLDLSELVVDGFKVAVLYGGADGIINPQTGAHVSDQRELNLKVEYLPESGALKDLYLQFIYSRAEFLQNAPGERIQDRIDARVTYRLPLL